MVEQHYHGNRSGNDYDQQPNLQIGGLFQLEIQNEQEAGDDQHRHEYPTEGAFVRAEAQKERQGQNHRNGGDGQTVVDLFAAVRLGLTIGFQHIEERQTDHAAEGIKAHRNAAENAPNAHKRADHHGKYPKADHIRQRIQLNAIELLVIVPVLFRPGDLAVEGVQQSGQGKADNGNAKMSVHCLGHAKNRGKYAEKRKYHGVIVKSDHVSSLFPMIKTAKTVKIALMSS